MGVATVLVHPEWFIRSAQGKGLLEIPLTLLKELINKVMTIFSANSRIRLILRGTLKYTTIKE